LYAGIAKLLDEKTSEKLSYPYGYTEILGLWERYLD